MRRVWDVIFIAIAAACAFAALAVLGGLVFAIARRGLPAISVSFFTEQIRLVGAQGGILWNLVGTVILLVTAFFACAPLAVALALLERVWLRSPRRKRWLRLGLYTMNGLAGIVFRLLCLAL